jgi:hypothetical protein
MFLLLFPAQTLEWNPIELVWNILVQWLAIFSLEIVRWFGPHHLMMASQVEEVGGC